MNKLFLNTCLNIFTLIASSTIFLLGCSADNSAFETPNTSDAPTNAGIISQKNFSVGSSDPFPKVYDPTKGFSEQTVEIIVTIGDIDNQLLTDQHTVFFKTEWGLIGPSCTTEAGKCSVTWQTSKFSNIPFDLLNTVTAWTIGEESFTDINGNGKFDDADVTFDDLVEPFVDINLDSVFDATAGDLLIDVVSSSDPFGNNEVHDLNDTFLNSPNCTHSSLCSTVKSTIFIWDDTVLNMAGPPP